MGFEKYGIRHIFLCVAYFNVQIDLIIILPLYRKMFQQIIQAIATGTPGEIEAKMAFFDFSTINYMTGMAFLDKFLTTARQKKPPRGLLVVEMLLAPYIDENDPDIDAFIGDLAGIAVISVDNLAYLIKIHEDIVPEMVLDINLESTDLSKKFSFGCIASRLEAAFKMIEEEKGGKRRTTAKKIVTNFLEKDSWQRLLGKAKDKERKDATAYILSKLEDLYPFAEVPKYMKTVVGKVPQCANDIDETKNTVKSIVTEMTTDESRSGVALEKLTEALDVLTSVELLSVVTGFNKKVAMVNDEDMLEGPSNRIKGSNCLGALSSHVHKDCRMLTCICIAEDEDDENWEIQKLSWFIKKCEMCSKKIRKACHALRLPRDSGGWVGCYCSEKCCVEAANVDIKHNFAGNHKHFERYSRYNTLTAQILFKGILDQEDSAFY